MYGFSRVGDRRLDGLVEERLGMVHQVGVERIVAGHQHHQRITGVVLTPGPGRLLPEGGDAARITGDDDGVEAADVDAEFESVGGGHPGQLGVVDGAFEPAPVVGEIPGPVGGHLADEIGCGCGEELPGLPGGEFGTHPAAGEAQRPRPLDHEIGQQPG